MMQTEPPPSSSLVSSPSFSSYSSSETFAQIAARVVYELSNDPIYHHSNSLFDDPIWPQNDIHPTLNDTHDDEDFEFSFVSRDPNSSSPVSADDIFHNGQITPTYPLFGRHIPNGVVSQTETATVRRRLPLRVLMFEERETPSCSSSSSSEEEENSSGKKDLVGVEEGTYCVWTPRACKKSSSTGSSSSWSRRWKLRDLFLMRSHSDGKDPMMLFVGPASKRNGSNKVAPKRNGSAADGGAAAAAQDVK